MTSVQVGRANNLGAWIAGAFLAQGVALVALSFTGPDRAYAIWRALYFATIYGFTGVPFDSVLCAVLGYAAIAPFCPSRAGAGSSFIVGGVCSLLALWVTLFSDLIIPSYSSRLIFAALMCAALGAWSYVSANRARSNNRWRVRETQ
jgi:hypothetical protein